MRKSLIRNSKSEWYYLSIKDLLEKQLQMKAVVLHKNGDLGRLKIEDVPEPKPQKNEVVVRLHSAALNHLDIWVR